MFYFLFPQNGLILWNFPLNNCDIILYFIFYISLHISTYYIQLFFHIVSHIKLSILRKNVCNWIKYGGIGRIMGALPVREVVGESTVSYQRRIEYKSYLYRFQRDAFHKMQENHDGEKERNPRLLINSVGHISWNSYFISYWTSWL